MNHIKSYKIFETTWDNKGSLPQNLIDDITDISTDLIDKGYSVEYNDHVGIIHKYPCILIFIPENDVFSEGNNFLYSDIKDFVKTIESHFNEYEYNIDVLYRNPHRMMESIRLLNFRYKHHLDEDKISSSLFRIDIIKII